MNNCLIHYFSGTGNTYHMVNIIRNQLSDRGYDVDILNIENDKNKELVDYISITLDNFYIIQQNREKTTW